MTVPLNERQRQILDRIEVEGEIKISELKQMFQVTEMTIRRDLEKLEQAYPIRRTFGGAIMVGSDIALNERSGVMMEEKKRIGIKAASLIQSGDSIFIDGGSTTVEIARAIKQGMDITVVTNAMNVAQELMNKRVPTIVTGGEILESTSTLIGPITTETLATMAFTHVFLGATGVTAKHGFSNSNVHEAALKKLAIRKAEEVNIVLDHTKFNEKVLVSFAQLDHVDRLISDQWPEPSLIQACEDAKVQIILA